jgi:acyl dehydratase
MRTFTSPQDLLDSVGENLGSSDWLQIDQDRINAFADATNDHQWIHVDPERAAEGPFGTTIAHGFLTLSLLSHFGWNVYTVENAKMTVNVGSNKVRFLNPVTVGSKLRGTFVLTDVQEAKDDAYQVVVTATVDLEGQDKPALIAETVSRIYF